VRESIAANKEFIVVVLILVVVVVACIPLAWAYDNRVNRSDTVFLDRQKVALLEYAQARDHGQARAIDVGPGESAVVGGSTFTPSEGVTVVVRLTTDGYCVLARNRDGDGTAWRCWDNGTDPLQSEGHSP
jgi:hypothetical protein